MEPLVPLFAFIVTMVIFFIVLANKQYRRDLKNNDVQKTEEEKDQEWLDNQW